MTRFNLSFKPFPFFHCQNITTQPKKVVQKVKSVYFILRNVLDADSAFAVRFSSFFPLVFCSATIFVNLTVFCISISKHLAHL